MRLPLFVLHIALFGSLLMRGRRWVGIVPFLGLLVLALWYYNRQQFLGENIANSFQHTIQTYGAVIAWGIFLIAVWHLCYMFGVLTYKTGFWFLGAHMMVYLVALLNQKKEIATIMHAGWWVSGLLIIWQSTQFYDIKLVVDMVSMLIVLTFALYAFVVFVIGSVGIKATRRLLALLFIFSQLAILVGVINYTSTITLWTILGGQIYLGVFYLILQRGSQERQSYLSKGQEVYEDDLLYRILRGERIQDTTVGSVSSGLSLGHIVREITMQAYARLPFWVFRVLGSLNLVLMAIQLILVVLGKTGDMGYWIDIGFWVSMLIYVMNYFVLQKQGIDVWGQRAMTFFLINFGIYLTIYHIFGNEPIYLVGCGVIWSVINAVLMIQVRYGYSAFALTKRDYQYWLFGNLSAIVANSYFMFLLPVSLQLRFTLVVMYLSLQALLLRYQLHTKAVPEE